MKSSVKAASAAAVFVSVGLLPSTVWAQCCAGYTEATVCAGTTLTKSRWCIQDTVPTGQNALPAEFCAYGDKVVTTLEQVFNIPAPEIFEFQLDTQTGGAHTGTNCGHLGDGVAYDAFVGNAYGATSFWGYLLALHEAINDWTGMSSSGWPTDWWADHQSAFPNLMDFHIMATIGTANNDMNLTKAAAAQKMRFYPGGDSADPKVVALDNVYSMMPNGDGYAGFSHLFSMQNTDGVHWDNLGVPNPDEKRSEYVLAYMSLATGQRVLSTLQGPGLNGGGEICNNTDDGAGDAPYTCNSDVIDAIATAHCSIVANGNPTADLTALRAGDYQMVPSGPCGASCPSECACSADNHCVAPWLAPALDAGVGDAGAGGMGSGGTPAIGGNGTGGSAGIAAAGGSGGSSVSNGGATVGVGGSTATTAGSGGMTGATPASGGTATGGSANASATSSDAGAVGSCGCTLVGRSKNPHAWIALGACLASLGALRRRRRWATTSSAR